MAQHNYQVKMDMGLSDQQKGISLMLVATFLFVTINAFIKDITPKYPVIEILFFRHFFALVVPICLIIRKGISLNSQNMPWHIVRGLASVISLCCLFKSLVLLPLSDAIILTFSTSLFLVVLSGFFLKEPIRFPVASAVLIGFFGVMIANGPSEGGNLEGFVLGLISALLEAGITLSSRFLTRNENSLIVTFYLSFFAALISLFVLPFVWVTPNFADFIALIFMGIVAGISQYLMVSAYQYANAGLIGALGYSAMLWSLIYGSLFFNETQRLSTYIGAFLILASGLYVIYSQEKESRRI